MEEVNQGSKLLVSICYEAKGNWDEIFNIIKSKRKCEMLDNEKLDNVITILDKDYPVSLKNAFRPPFVLFYKGDKVLLNGVKQIIAIINDNMGNNYSYDKTLEIGKDLKDKAILCLLYGGKKNNDLINKFIDNGNELIVILTEPFSSDDELLNKIIDNGLVISIYPKTRNVKSKSQLTECSNLMTALANILLVGSISKNSCNVAAVSQAIQYDKEIFCLPTLAGSNYLNNELIKKGANLIENVEDLNLKVYGK